MKNKPFFLAMLVSLLAFGLTLNSCAGARSAPSIDAVTGLSNKLAWLRSNAQSGGNYIIEIDADESPGFCGSGAFMLVSCGQLFFTDGWGPSAGINRRNITITIRGVGSNRTIRGGFSVGPGVTLILDDKITLSGSEHSISSVLVSSGGTLVMNDGSAIKGNKSLMDGAGVHVSDGGTFIMKGGTISGNSSFPSMEAAERAANEAMMSAGTSRALYSKTTRDNERNGILLMKGGGVYVSGKGTFTKTGGTITGYTGGTVTPDNPGNDNLAWRSVRAIKVDSALIDNALYFGTHKVSLALNHNNGHAIYFADSKSIDTTVGPEVSFNFSNGKFSETQKEETAPPDVPTATQTPQDATQKYQDAILKAQQEMQDATQKALQEAIQKMPAEQQEEIQKAMQEATQKYQEAIQKMPAEQQEVIQKMQQAAIQQATIQAAIQKMPIAQQEEIQKAIQEAIQKNQEAILKAQQEMQEAMQKAP